MMSADDFDLDGLDLRSDGLPIGGQWIGNAYSFSCRCTLTAELGPRDYERLMHGTGAPCSMSLAEQLREEAGLPTTVRLEAVAALVDRVGDDDLAVDAMTMIPRPRWVSELLGLHSEHPVEEDARPPR